MNILNVYLNFLQEDEEIHPKRKEAISWFAATPASDVATGAVSGTIAYRAAKSLGKSGVEAVKDVGLHSAKWAAISMAAYAAYRYTRSLFDKCTKNCGMLNINTTKRQICLLSCKKELLEKQLELLKKEKSKPEEINKIINDLKIVRKKIESYKTYLKKDK